MFLKSFTISCFTSVLVSLPVLAGDYSGKCFNQAAQEHDKCTISISEETLLLAFEDSPEANMGISVSEIRSIDESQDKCVGAATVLVSPFPGKKVREFTITYSDEERNTRIASFRMKKKRSTALRTDLVTFSGVVVNQIE